MKILVIILFFLSQIAYSQADSLILGNKFFVEAKYDKAIDTYKKIEASNLGGFGLYSNMARSYSYLGQVPLAILYFEKALVLKPNNDQVLKDLNDIRKRNPDLDIPPEPFFGQKLWTAIVGLFLPGIWAILSLFFLALIGLFSFWHLYQHKIDRKLAISVIPLTLIFIFSLLAAYNRDQQIYHNKVLIIISDNVTLKAGPDQLSPDISEIPAGAKVFKTDFLGQWFHVTNEYGNAGWIKSNDVRSI